MSVRCHDCRREWSEYEVSREEHLTTCDGCGLWYCFGCGDFSSRSGYDNARCSECFEHKKPALSVDDAIIKYKKGEISAEEAMKNIIISYT